MCSTVAKNNPDIIVGLKLRLDKNITDGGRIENEVLRRALEIAEEAKLPLMVHHTNSGIPFDVDKNHQATTNASSNLYVPGSLRPGDIYTHTYSRFAGSNSSIYDLETKSVRKEIQR